VGAHVQQLSLSSQNTVLYHGLKKKPLGVIVISQSCDTLIRANVDTASAQSIVIVHTDYASGDATCSLWVF
jgi:hypothetical protein